MVGSALWKHGSTTDTDVVMTGSRPELTIYYDPAIGDTNWYKDNKISVKHDIVSIDLPFCIQFVIFTGSLFDLRDLVFKCRIRIPSFKGISFFGSCCKLNRRCVVIVAGRIFRRNGSSVKYIFYRVLLFAPLRIQCDCLTVFAVILRISSPSS